MIKYGGIWGTVSDDNFDDDDAKVACYMLGFGYVRLKVFQAQLTVSFVFSNCVIFIVFFRVSQSLLPVLVVNLCFCFFVYIPALVLPFYSINYVCKRVRIAIYRRDLRRLDSKLLYVFFWFTYCGFTASFFCSHLHTFHYYAVLPSEPH